MNRVRSTARSALCPSRRLGRRSFAPHADSNQTYAAKQCDCAQNGWNGNSAGLFMADLEGSGTHIFLFVCERKSAQCKAYNPYDDEDYPNYGCWFHVFTFLIQMPWRRSGQDATGPSAPALQTEMLSAASG